MGVVCRVGVFWYASIIRSVSPYLYGVVVMIDLRTVARALGITVEEAERRAVTALIRGELRRIRAEKASILSRYGIRGFDDLWRRIEEDTLDDTLAHDDIVRLDYLEHKERELERLLRELRV